MAQIIQVIFGKETPVAGRPDGYTVERIEAELRNDYLTSWLVVQKCVERPNGDIAIYTALKLYRAVISPRFWTMLLKDLIRRLKQTLTVGGS